MGNSPTNTRNTTAPLAAPGEGPNQDWADRDLQRLTDRQDNGNNNIVVMLKALPTAEASPNANPQNHTIFSFSNRREENGIFMACAGDEKRKVVKQYRLERQYSTFSTSISINDSAHFSEVGSSASPVRFEVSGFKSGDASWRQLLLSRPISTRNDMYDIRLDVRGQDGLQIAVWCEDRNLEHAHAIWIDPRLTIAPGIDLSSLPVAPVDYPLEGDLDVTKVHHTGTIEKKGDDMLGLWSSRFFVLDGHVLRWFSDGEAYASSGEENGHLHLNDIIAIHEWHDKPKMFHVELAGRTYQLRCSSPEEVSTWVALMHFISQLEDRSLRRSNSSNSFSNFFKVHSVAPSGVLSNTELRFDEAKGVSSAYKGKEEWSTEIRDIHSVVKTQGGNGNRFAIVTYSYKEFEGASQAQLHMIEQSISTLKGQRAKPQAHRAVQVFKNASLNLFEDEAEFLAKGGYGKVYKVKEKGSGEYYALKVIEVGRKFDKEFIDSSIKEREVLVAVASGCPFLVRLHSVWHENLNVFFCLELAEAGDMTNVMKQHQHDRLPSALAGFYFAEVINVLRFLHARGTVYRDLKPENLLVSSEGHIKLTDFGLAKQGLDDTAANMTSGCTTFKGTPEYYAPEVLNAGKGGGHYGLAADWWAVGILFYEMQAGLYQTPFPSGNRDHGALNRMYQAILTRQFRWTNPLPSWAGNLPHMRSLIEGLLVKDPNHRIGTPAAGLKAMSGDNIKSHPYFSEELPKLLSASNPGIGPIDIDSIDKQVLTPPWVPAVKNKQRSKASLSQFKGAASDPRINDIGNWRGNAADVTDGATFLGSLGFK